MDIGSISNFLQNPENQTTLGVVFSLVAVWSLVWKGFALYHASRHEEKIWFIIILVINLAGIVEILYLFYFSKDKITSKQVKEFAKSINFAELGKTLTDKFKGR